MSDKNFAIAAAINLVNPEQATVWYLDNNGYAGVLRENIQDSIPASASTDQRSEARVKTKPASEVSVFGPNDPITPPKFDPPFKSSWSFAQAGTKFMTYVFGVRDDKKVCMVSPTYKPFPKAEASTFSLAACGSTNDIKGPADAVDKVKFFYLIREDQNAAQAHLVEYTLQPEHVEKLVVKVDKDSRLCAYRDKDIDYCFFLSNGRIHCYDTLSKSSDMLRHASGALPTTPMAVCTLYNVTCLFFLNSDSDLMVVECQNKVWGNSKPAGNPTEETATRAGINTDLAAIASTRHNAIIVYYRHGGSTNDYDSWTWNKPKFD